MFIPPHLLQNPKWCRFRADIGSASASLHSANFLLTMRLLLHHPLPLLLCHSDVPRRLTHSLPYSSRGFSQSSDPPILSSSPGWHPSPSAVEWVRRVTFNGQRLNIRRSQELAAGRHTLGGRPRFHSSRDRAASVSLLSSRPLVAAPSRRPPLGSSRSSGPVPSPAHPAAHLPPARHATGAVAASSDPRARASGLRVQRRRFKRSRLVRARSNSLAAAVAAAAPAASPALTPASSATERQSDAPLSISISPRSRGAPQSSSG